MVTDHTKVPRFHLQPAIFSVAKHDLPVNNDIKGLIGSVNDSSTSAFMWEWFTTKPWLDSGEVRFVRTLTKKNLSHMLKFAGQIGSVPTPWPSWLIAAHTSTDLAPKGAVRSFLNTLTSFVVKFDSQESRDSVNIPFIQKTWGYPEDDIKVQLPCLDSMQYF